MKSNKRRLNIVFVQTWKKTRQGLLQLLSANVINKIVVMISNMVITRILTRSDFGMWGYILNIYSYASLIAGFGLDSGAFQFGAENKGKGEAFKYYKYCLNIGLIINIAIIAVFYLYIHIAEMVIENSGLYIKIYLPVLIIEYTSLQLFDF